MRTPPTAPIVNGPQRLSSASPQTQNGSTAYPVNALQRSEPNAAASSPLPQPKRLAVAPLNEPKHHTLSAVRDAAHTTPLPEGSSPSSSCTTPNGNAAPLSTTSAHTTKTEDTTDEHTPTHTAAKEPSTSSVSPLSTARVSKNEAAPLHLTSSSHSSSSASRSVRNSSGSSNKRDAPSSYCCSSYYSVSMRFNDPMEYHRVVLLSEPNEVSVLHSYCAQSAAEALQTIRWRSKPESEHIQSHRSMKTAKVSR